MGIFIGILTGILVLLCIFLVLIILMQKSKQEAGLGSAFGGAATEQLFGAGTTSVLTKATIWGTVMFFVITLILAMYYSHEHTKGGGLLQKVSSTADTNALPVIAAAPGTNEAAKAVTTATNAAPALTETNAPATK